MQRRACSPTHPQVLWQDGFTSVDAAAECFPAALLPNGRWMLLAAVFQKRVAERPTHLCFSVLRQIQPQRLHIVLKLRLRLQLRGGHCMGQEARHMQKATLLAQRCFVTAAAF